MPWTRWSYVPVAILLLAGCGGCMRSVEHRTYRLACEALANDPNVPKDAKPHSMRHAQFSIAKNAARVDLPYDTVTEAGERLTDFYTVRFKRVARTWTVERAHPAPNYPAAEGETAVPVLPAP